MAVSSHQEKLNYEPSQTLSFLKTIKAGIRAAATITRSCPGWKRDLAMSQCRESDLQRAAEKGLLPEGTLQYANEIIKLNIQGKEVAKTRWQWAQWKNSQRPFPSYPYRSYDSDMTKGKNIHDALLDLVSFNKANPELSLDELHNLIQNKYWSGYFASPSVRASELLEGAKSDLPQHDPQSPRMHHYQFAYRALPGMAFSDPRVPLGFGQDIPKGSLIKFWKHVGTRFPENERISDSGLFASDTPFGPDYVMLLVTLPTPLRETEAHYVAIIYPRQWFESPDYENTSPELQVFILARSNVTDAGETSGGTLRILTKTGHGALKFGIPATVEAFVKEIQTALQHPLKWITWVDSKPWDFVMQNDEAGQPYIPAQVADPLMLGKTELHKKLRIVILDDEEGPRRASTAMLKHCWPLGAEILEFEDAADAWRELLRADPDLFITDIAHPGMTCLEMLTELSEREVKYPVLVISARLGLELEAEKHPEAAAYIQQLKRDWRPNLNVTFLPKPWTTTEFRSALDTALNNKIHPVLGPPIETKPIRKQTKAPKPRGKLLVVDDEEGPRESMRVIFQDEYDMFFAEDGPAAIKIAQENDIEVVVTNIRMAGMSGIEVLERLKSFKPEIEVIMMTAFKTNDTIRQSLRLGACDYINKPFDLATMRTAVSKAMKRRTRK